MPEAPTKIDVDAATLQCASVFAQTFAVWLKKQTLDEDIRDMAEQLEIVAAKLRHTSFTYYRKQQKAASK